MSFEITTAFVQQYKANIELLAQQMGSRLRNAVRVETVTGQHGFFDQIGGTTATKRTSRHADTVHTNTPHSRRRVTPAPSDVADLIDQEDRVKLYADPTSDYVRAMVAALGRAMDTEIITAALGTAYTGVDGSTAVTLPAAQKIAVGTTGMTLAKLQSAKEILDAGDVDEMYPRYIAYTSKQLSDLLGTTQVTSSDYNTVKALVAGQIDTFMGFKFIRTELLPLDPAAATTRQCIAWAQPGLLLGLSADINATVDRIPLKNNATQVFASMHIGATRMQEKMVVQIDCKIA